MLSTKTNQVRTEISTVIASETVTASTASQVTTELPVSSVVKTRKRGDKQIIVSPDERSDIASFIRMIRSNYWLSDYIKVLIRLDAESPNMIPISEAERQLKKQKDIEELVERVQYCCRNKNNFHRDSHVLKAIADEWTDIFEYQSDSRIRALIESAKQAAKK